MTTKKKKIEPVTRGLRISVPKELEEEIREMSARTGMPIRNILDVVEQKVFENEFNLAFAISRTLFDKDLEFQHTPGESDSPVSEAVPLPAPAPMEQPTYPAPKGGLAKAVSGEVR